MKYAFLKGRLFKIFASVRGWGYTTRSVKKQSPLCWGWAQKIIPYTCRIDYLLST